ncbi:hypothetical protein V2J09_005446 [Rumex salicifolius]
MDLIPGLPDDMARECLNRVPFTSFRPILSVCKAWNREIRDPDFHRVRRLTGQVRPVFILADVSVRHKNNRNIQNPPKLFFQLAIFDPGSEPGPESFIYLPPAPPLPPDEFSTFNITGIVGIGTDVIVTLFVTKRQGGDFVNLVYVFDFLTGQWRRGADIPGQGRSVLGLAAGDPIRRKVLVSGGEQLKSAFLYDVARDEWLRVSDMERARFQCSVVFHGDRFHVIGGRSMSEARPGDRMTCAESLDPVTLEWGRIDNEFLEASASDYHWVMGNGEGEMYQISQNVTFRRGSSGEWRHVAEVPNDLKQHVTCAMTWRDKMIVIGRRPRAYVLDLKSREWSEHELPYEMRKATDRTKAILKSKVGVAFVSTGSKDG